MRALKYDRTEHRTWKGQLVRREGPLIVLDATFDRTIAHEHLGTIAEGTLSSEYYWFDRWYNVFVFRDPSGDVENYYCNISEPATFDGQVLTYIDLDVDVVVNRDFSFKILDQEEFDANALKYRYPAELQARSRRALSELVKLIRIRAFPFT